MIIIFKIGNTFLHMSIQYTCVDSQYMGTDVFCVMYNVAVGSIIKF